MSEDRARHAAAYVMVIAENGAIVEYVLAGNIDAEHLEEGDRHTLTLASDCIRGDVFQPSTTATWLAARALRDGSVAKDHARDVSVAGVPQPDP